MNKITPLVSFVVVNYNGRQYLKECFSALSTLDYPKDKIEIFMIDNCSTDDSIKFMKKNFPNVKVFKNNVNNYARANNLGIKKSKGDYIAFINNDLQVSRNWLPELLKIMAEEKRAGAVSGKILLTDNRIHSTGHEEYPDFYWGDRGFKSEDKGQYEKIEEVISLCGAAVLFRRACLEDIGFFDEDFIMYLEDVDICFRAAKNKWKLFYAPKSIARHYFSGTSNPESVRYFSERNRLLLAAKHFPEKLGGALYGKGYFIQEQRSIYDVLPLVISKLLECHGADYVKSALPIICGHLKKISVLEKSILINKTGEFENIITQQEASIAELNEAKKELTQQARDMSNAVKAKDLLLEQQEASIAELSKAKKELILRIEDMSKSAKEKDSLSRQQEASIAELNEAKKELTQQARDMSRSAKEKDSLLKQQKSILNQIEADLFKVKEELKAGRDDLNRVSRFDLKRKILLIKPQIIGIEDTVETVRIIKKKYPNSRVYLLANLLKRDYEKIANNNNIEKGLIYCSSSPKPYAKTEGLFGKAFFTRFDITITLVSNKQTENYSGYKKAKAISLLSCSKNRCNYYVD